MPITLIFTDIHCSENSEREIIPSPKYLAAKSFGFLTAKMLVYPLQTCAVKLVTREVNLSGIPRLFANWESLKSLYRGFFTNMLWSLGYAISCNLMEYGLFQVSLTGEEAVGGGFIAASSILSLGIVPLRVKALFDRAGIPYDFTWRLSFYRFVLGLCAKKLI